MKKQTRLIALALLVLAVALSLFVFFRPVPPEPIHAGRPLRDWLVDFDQSPSTTNYTAACAAIRAMGTNALPALIRYLSMKDPRFNRQRVSLKAKFKMRFNPGGEYALFWHRRAATACGELGEAGAPAFPAMAEAMQETQAASDVGSALSRMLPASAPVLTNVLATGAIVARCRAADALTTAGWHPTIEEMARTALLRALQDTNAGLRATAATALQFWNKRLDLVIPALTRVLSDPDVSARGNAASALGQIGKPAVPELIKLLNDTSAYPGRMGTLGERAMNVLKQIDPEAAARAKAEAPSNSPPVGRRIN